MSSTGRTPPWSVEAGPYVVYVTGTAFDVRWSGANEVIEVRMRSGSVQVGGPLLPERVTLRAGQQLTAKLRERRAAHRRGARAATARGRRRQGARRAGRRRRRAAPGDGRRIATAPAPELAATAARSVGAAPQLPPSPLAAPQPRPTARAAAASRRGPWRRRTRRPPAAPRPVRRRAPRDGARASIRSASRRGRGCRPSPAATRRGSSPRRRRTASTRRCSRSTARALVALADAVRYSGRPEIAVRAFIAERQRFPNTPAAHAAAFFLGRLADDRGEVAAGLAWYRRYLGEMPQGPYAAEALGRKMLAVERISGRDAARSVGGEYIERFPNGTYMLQAHSILANPTP